MKKIVTIFLAMSLTLAISSPVFAIEETEYLGDDEWITGGDSYAGYYIPDMDDAIIAPDETVYTRLSMGGTEDGLAVLFNGAYLSFPDAGPETNGGITMVPLRAFVEALGGEVDYLPETGEMTAFLNGVQMRFSAGSKAATVDIGGETQTAALQCAPYIRDGVTYVSIRSVSELAGYDVYWDSDFETVVIIDSASIISDIDQNFSIINKIFSISTDDYDTTKNYRTVGDILISYTELNSLDGDRTADVTVKIRAIQEGLNEEMSVTVDATQLLAILLEEDSIMLDDETLALLESASDLSMDMILNTDEECMYVKSNLFEAMGMDVDENTWILFGSDYLGAAIEEYENMLSSDYYPSFLSSESMTVGSYIYSVVSEMDSTYGSGSVFIYRDVYEAAADIAFLNDGMFTQIGNTYTLNMNLDNYDKFLTAVFGEDYDEYYAEEFLYTFKELDVTLKITDYSGIVSVSGDFNIRGNPDYSYIDTRYSGSFSLSAEKLTMDIEVHVKNESKILVSIDLTATETYQTASDAPPAGSTIVDHNDLLATLYDQNAA